jgi:hypothetical protein
MIDLDFIKRCNEELKPQIIMDMWLIIPLIEQIDKIKLSRLMGRYRAKVGDIIKIYKPAYISEDATIAVKIQYVKNLTNDSHKSLINVKD